jgi:hypothetical protein
VSAAEAVGDSLGVQVAVVEVDLVGKITSQLFLDKIILS